MKHSAISKRHYKIKEKKILNSFTVYERVFIIAMVTLEITGISNKYNKYSHLIGGIIMLIIGLLMIFKPSILMLNF